MIGRGKAGQESDSTWRFAVRCVRTLVCKTIVLVEKWEPSNVFYIISERQRKYFL